MKFVSLFAGVGGFDLGLERSGHTCIGQVEIDKNARKVLEHHWPDVPKHDDVTTAIDWADENGITGSVELICGGFPCQDLSVAGKRAGLAGKRSGLFYDALRFATHTKAKTILLENVPGLLSSNQGRDFGAVLTSLADSGYSNIEWRVLNSQFFGVPQRRRRVFIVANLGSGGGAFKPILSESESSAGDFTQSQSQGQNITSTATGSIRTFGESSFGQFKPGIATLKASGGNLGGGERNIISNQTVGALCAVDFKGPNNQYVEANKLVVVRQES
jgi:DNA (cytosine-5)-methyltransferase 1